MRHVYKLLLLLFVLPLASHSYADKIDNLETLLRDHPQVQEKIYIHTDNNCYFVGDTLWYRAFVVRSDDFHPTDISKLLYVELVNPDGIVVERQRLIISDNGITHGDFVLRDSMYSGYYELRAYTRWNLNFGVSHRKYVDHDKWKFYNYQLAADYFRQWDGLYSRVLAIYEKPKEEGNYFEKYIINRPKEDLMSAPKTKLKVRFFPEGGTFVKGVKNHVAFEVLDQEGRYVDISGRLSDGTIIKTLHQGRGVFEITPVGDDLNAVFSWQGKEWKFKIPKPSDSGATLHYDDGSLTLQGANVAAYAVMCRGKMCMFQRAMAGSYNIDTTKLPTGINEIIVFDSAARPVADRLFFVDNKDMSVKTTIVSDKLDYMPFEKISVKGKADITAPLSVSVSVRDASSDDASYDDGDMLTEMLLTGELRGFIAYPGWYFERDDEAHRKALDNLMLVQGWRRYRRVSWLRYAPEKNLTVEGHVYKVPNWVEFTEVDQIYRTEKDASVEVMDAANAASAVNRGATAMDGTTETEGSGDENYFGYDISDVQTNDNVPQSIDETDVADMKRQPIGQTVNNKSVPKNVLVESELEKGGQSAGAIQKIDGNGYFKFNIPPFFGKSILFIKAYKQKDSLKYAMSARRDKHWRDERAYPEFYVKRDMFYPVFAKPYNWYQTHQPEMALNNGLDEALDSVMRKSRLAGEHQLSTVKVIASKRSRRGINYDKPAQIVDFYSLYNNVTDYGLSFGIFEANRFPMQAATFLYGNLGMNRKMNIRGMIDGTSFYRNYERTLTEFDRNQASSLIFAKMRIDRLKDVKVYCDFEPRNNDGMVFHTNSPSITMEYETFPDDARQYSYRDRRYVFDGIALPDKFYTPDYGSGKPQPQKDYRRTLYWNPDVKVGADGIIDLHCYNNSRQTRVKVSLAGITAEGKVLSTQ